MIHYDSFKFQFDRLVAAFPRKKPSPATAEVYYDALKDRLSVDDLGRAVSRAISEGEYFPSIARLFAYAGVQAGEDAGYPRETPYSLKELWDEIGEENMSTFVGDHERNDVVALVAIRNMLRRTGQLEPAGGEWWD